MRSVECGSAGDSDLDTVCDDGDDSGVSGDNPCMGGNKVMCDDNCPEVANSDQADEDGDGVGDFCDDNGNAGENGGPCYSDSTCSSGLKCVDDICEIEDINAVKVDKAIIVAGGGPYAQNTLWEATQLVSQNAYKTLDYQRFNKDTIYFLSSDTVIDLDGNDLFDDVDGDATKENLEYAITEWAKDADDLVIFITDHGGDGYFRMSSTEELTAEDLDSWLDEMQQTVDGMVTVIYDACESGSFVSKLTPPAGKDRIVITSSSRGEEAFFLSSGSISFSFYFWGHVLTGATLYDSFLLARNAMEEHQTPLLDDNGNGIPGEEGIDGLLARNQIIGAGFTAAADFPTIGSICPEVTLAGNTSATIWVENIIPSNNISRVWAVIIPPNFVSIDSSVPVTDLPICELTFSENRYEGEFTAFTSAGTYRIYVYAKDTAGNMSIPLRTNVVQTSDSEVCPAARLLGSKNERTDLLRSFRDDVLLNSNKGRELVDLYYEHSFELLMIMIFNPEIMERSRELLDCIIPDIEEMVSDRKLGSTENTEQINKLLDLIMERAGPELKNGIMKIKGRFTH